MTERATVYDKITERILAMLEAGVAPWQPGHNCKAAQPGKNVTGRSYRGINAVMTWAVASVAGYSSPYWLTYNQARELGGNVKKGEKGTPVVFWGQAKTKGESEDEGKGYMFAKGYTVFNLEQIEGLKAEDLPVEADSLERWSNDPIEAAEAIVSGFDGPSRETLATTPHYSPSRDCVVMPPMDRFATAEEYYSVYFHELAHSTGHESRLDRKLTEQKTRETYGQEELVAEFAAAFLCHECGIERATIENSAAYLDGWKKAIKGDVKLLVMAASQAQKAVDCILGKSLVAA